MNKKKKYKNYIAVSFFWGKVTGIFQVGFSWFVRKQKRRRKIPNYYKNGRNTITGKKDVIYFIKWVFTKNKGTYLLREEFVWWLVDCICSFSTSGFESQSFTYLAQESTSVTGIFQVGFPYLEILSLGGSLNRNSPEMPTSNFWSDWNVVSVLEFTFCKKCDKIVWNFPSWFLVVFEEREETTENS